MKSSTPIPPPEELFTDLATGLRALALLALANAVQDKKGREFLANLKRTIPPIAFPYTIAAIHATPTKQAIAFADMAVPILNGLNAPLEHYSFWAQPQNEDTPKALAAIQSMAAEHAPYCDIYNQAAKIYIHQQQFAVALQLLKRSQQISQNLALLSPKYYAQCDAPETQEYRLATIAQLENGISSSQYMLEKLFQGLSPDDQEEVIAFARFRLEHQKAAKQK